MKSQTTSLVLYQTFEFNYRDAIPLHITHWWRVSDTLKVVEENRKTANDYDRAIATNIDDLTWADKQYVEKFLCANHRVEFDLVRTFDALGTVPYEEKTKYVFKCEMFPFFDNNWMRLHHWVEMFDPDYKAEYQLKSLDPNGKESKGRKTVPEDEK